MPDLSPGLVLLATVVSFLIGAVYYMAFSSQMPTAGPDDQSRWRLGVEVIRCLVTVTVIGVLAELTGVVGWAGGLALGLILWIGFPLMLWLGAVVHEGTPVRTAVIHAGDWLVKLVVVASIFGIWG